jgi:hypothetical protein
MPERLVERLDDEHCIVEITPSPPDYREMVAHLRLLRAASGGTSMTAIVRDALAEKAARELGAGERHLRAA